MRATSTDALLLVDKSAGRTSHDVVSLARRVLGTPRVGHAGTLDPFATGLLVLLIGRGTRLLQFVPGEPKVYAARVRFGSETDSDDLTGSTTRFAPLPTPAVVREALASLTGSIQQIPPDYSAKHVAGERAYRVARRGERPALSPVTVVVHRWEVLEQQDDFLHARITCAGGTYIRALARDLGRLVGSAAHLAELRRERAGAFDVVHACSMEQLRDGEASLLPLEAALGGMPRQTLDPDAVCRVMHGRSVPAREAGERAALLSPDGELVAVADREGDEWHPKVVVGAG